MAEVDIDRNAQIVHRQQILFELDNGFRELVRSLVDVVAHAYFFMKVVPIRIQQQDDVLNLASLNEVLQFFDKS